MRKISNFVVIPVAAFVAAAVLVGWLKGVGLQERHLALHLSQEELRRLQAEHTRLGDRLAEVESRRRSAPRPSAVAREDVRPTEERPAGPALALGEWTASTAWQNEGRHTARAAMSTLLWAAAGGEVRTWQEMLEFDDASRRAARELLAKVSPAVRGEYASAEDLVASVAMTRVPVTEAQLMWLRETDADHAIVGLRLANAEGLAAAGPAAPDSALAPPRLPDLNRDKMVVLALHRTASGWRVVVPAAAIERLAGELGAPLAKR